VWVNTCQCSGKFPLNQTVDYPWITPLTSSLKSICRLDYWWLLSHIIIPLKKHPKCIPTTVIPLFNIIYRLSTSFYHPRWCRISSTPTISQLSPKFCACWAAPKTSRCKCHVRASKWMVDPFEVWEWFNGDF